EEFHVKRATGTAFDILQGSLALQLASHATSLSQLIAPPYTVAKQLLNCASENLRGFGIAIDRPRLTQGLPLPQRRYIRSKMLFEFAQWHGQRSNRADGPQQRINRVQPTFGSQLGNLF